MKASRPNLAPSYGIRETTSGGGLIRWETIETRLEAARNYWIATTNADGTPHVTPIWGVWLDHYFFFGTDPASRKAANIAINPSAVVHLESGDDAVILHCKVAIETNEAAVQTVLAEYRAKYGMPADFRFDPVMKGTPETAFAWSEHDFPASATRFRRDA